jgi:hypothetical protein
MIFSLLDCMYALLPTVCVCLLRQPRALSAARCQVICNLQGCVPLHVLAGSLAAVLTMEDAQQHCVLSQFSVDDLLFAPDLQHEDSTQAAILCACCCVDPWNTVSQAAACQVGNFNQVRRLNPPLFCCHDFVASTASHAQPVCRRHPHTCPFSW